MKMRRRRSCPKEKGFSLIEVLVGIALVSVAMMGLAHLFILGIMNNTRSDRLTNGTFLAMQQVEHLRSLTSIELQPLQGTPIDEQLDVNGDLVLDYRRITDIQIAGFSYEVRVLVFAQDQLYEDRDTLIADPLTFKVKADITTLISR